MELQGNVVAEKIYDKVKAKLKELDKKPLLAVILVGENPASLSYIKVKEKVAEKLGIGFRLYQFPEIVRQDEIGNLIINLNKNPYINGIVLQLPLPSKLDTDKLISQISKDKDVDGFLGEFPAPTAAAILEILNSSGFGLHGRKVVLVGKGKLVGEPLAKMLESQGVNFTACDSKTKDLGKVTKEADILISATGEAGLIKENFVKQGAVLIDAGASEVGGKISGDIDPKAYKKAKMYSPVPGGVGPVTVAMLMKNLVEAAKKEL